MKILVVDDSQNEQILVRHILLRYDKTIQILEAMDCRDAHDLIAKEAVHCILMDQKLAGRSGIDCIQEIRQAGYQGALIMLTGYADEALVIQAMKNGADDFLHKDTALDKLLGPRIVQAIAKRVEVAKSEAIANQKQQEVEQLLAEMDRLAAKVKAHFERK